MKYFVWIKNTHGLPEAQIWFGKQTDGNGKAKETLKIIELSEEEGKIGIRALTEKYPYEVKECL
jgi:hypothetical protein